MAKGSRGGKRKGGGSAKGELTLPDGSKIEFEGTLHFDGDDINVTGNARKTITDWEKKRGKNKIEYAYATDADGNPLGGEIKGGKGSVRVPVSYHDEPNGIFSHIHPRGDGMLGGTFSGADCSNFVRFKQKTVRARAKEGTYSLSKGKNFDGNGFLNMQRKAEGDFRKNIRDREKVLAKQYRDGSINYNQYLQGNAKCFNTELVKLHNSLRDGQKKYGYTYTLERNK